MRPEAFLAKTNIRYDSKKDERVVVGEGTYWVNYSYDSERNPPAKTFQLRDSFEIKNNDRTLDVYPNGEVTELRVTDITIRKPKRKR